MPPTKFADFPELYVSCPVEVFTDPSNRRPILGYVMMVKSCAADLVVFGEGQISTFVDCWHVDDPRCEKARPESWGQNNRAIFRLSPGEVQRRAHVRRMDQLETALAELAGKVSRLENPKRGRPAKVKRLSQVDSERYSPEDEPALATTP